MKKIIAILLAAVLLTAAFAGCSGKKPEDGKLKIITTIFPVYEWVSHVTAGTQNTDVSLLLNKGVDMHSFQPTTKDIVNISDCDVFVYVGGESDKWVEDVLRDASNKNMLTLNLMDALGDLAKEEEAVEGMQGEEASPLISPKSSARRTQPTRAPMKKTPRITPLRSTSSTAAMPKRSGQPSTIR